MKHSAMRWVFLLLLYRSFRSCGSAFTWANLSPSHHPEYLKPKPVVMFKSMPPLYDPVVWAIPFFLILISIELYVNWKQQLELYEKKEALSSIGMGLGSLVIDILMKALAYGTYTIIYQFRLFEIGWHWWSWVLI